MVDKVLVVALFIMAVINLVNTTRLMDLENRLEKLEKEESLEPIEVNGEVRGYYIRKGEE